jgi:hypothetical protein
LLAGEAVVANHLQVVAVVVVVAQVVCVRLQVYLLPLVRH